MNPRPKPADAPPYQVQNRYRLTQRLGAGWMTITYRAHDDRLNRDVAIKFITRPAEISPHAEQFVREARIVKQLNHPHIGTIYDVGIEAGWCYLITEHIPGNSLYDLMIQHGPYSVGEILPILRAVLEALDYAHQQGILHRNIRLHKIRVTPEHHIKLIDFAVVPMPSDLNGMEDEAGATLFGYMPPELLSGSQTDERTDLYSVGIVLYELLIGQPPFMAMGGASVRNILKQQPTIPAERLLPPEVAHVLLKLLAKDPAQRYASARETLNAIAAWNGRALANTGTGNLPLGVPQWGGDPGLANTLNFIEAERSRLAALIESRISAPLNLLLSQAETYQQSLGANNQAQMVASVLLNLGQQVMQHTRDLTTSLHPRILETLGLEPALEALAGQIERSRGIPIALELERLRDRLPALLEMALYRAVEEAIERAVHHDHASRITVRLSHPAGDQRQVALWVIDNGVLMTGTERLLDVRRWITQLGGSFDMQPEPDGGSLLAITFLLNAPTDLTPRERDVLRLVAEGRSNKQIGGMLGISPRTVNFHLDNLYSKLGINTRAEAAVYAVRLGLATPSNEQDKP